MKANRVHCDECQNFTQPDFKVSFNIINLMKIEKAGCKEGKKVMFRMPDSENFYTEDLWGWIRYCDKFKPIVK